MNTLQIILLCIGSGLIGAIIATIALREVRRHLEKIEPQYEPDLSPITGPILQQYGFKSYQTKDYDMYHHKANRILVTKYAPGDWEAEIMEYGTGRIYKHKVNTIEDLKLAALQYDQVLTNEY